MSDVDENLPPPSVENGATQQPPPAAAETAPDPVEQVKDQIAESLKAGTFDEVLPAPVDPETPKPAAKPAEPEAAKAPATPDASKATEPAEDPDALFDEEGDATPDEVDPRFTKIRERIQKTRSTLRETRKKLAEHERRVETARLAGFDDKSFEDWVLLGARANMGDPAAISELARRVQTAGYKFTPAEPAKPSEPAESEVQALYAKHFKSRVEAYQMDEAAALDAAKSLAAEIRASRAPALSQPQVPPQQAPQAQHPGQPQADPIRQRIEAHMDQLDADYAKALPNWKDVKAEADKLVHADIKAGKRLDPLMWVSDWQMKVRQAQIVLSQRAAKAAGPAVRVADTTLRPGRGSSPTGGGPANSPEEHRRRIAAALSAGNLDDLP